MTIQAYISKRETVLKQWIIAALRYLPTQDTIEAISLETWIGTFPALRKEAMEEGVTGIPQADPILFNYVMSLQPKRTA